MKNRTKLMICTLIVGTMGLVNTPAMAATNNAIHENKTVFQGVTIIEKQYENDNGTTSFVYGIEDADCNQETKAIVQEYMHEQEGLTVDNQNRLADAGRRSFRLQKGNPTTDTVAMETSTMTWIQPLEAQKHLILSGQRTVYGYNNSPASYLGRRIRLDERIDFTVTGSAFSVSLPPSFTFSPATSSATYSDSTEFSLNTNEFGARSVFAGTTVEAETPGLTGRITGKYTAKVTSYYGTYSVATTANDSYSTI